MNNTKYIYEPSKERLWYMEVIVIADSLVSLGKGEHRLSHFVFFFRRAHFMLKKLMLLY